MLAVLALGQSCDPPNLLPAVTGDPTDTTGQPTGDGTNSRQTPTGINASPSGSSLPEMGAEVAIRIVNQSRQDTDVVVRYLVANTEVRRTELHVPAGVTMPSIGPDLAVVVVITGKHANGAALPQSTLQLGQQFEAGDVRDYVIPDPDDRCPADPNKYEPGQCGCGLADTDTDGDGVPDCIDECPADPLKATPGECGCGVAEGGCSTTQACCTSSGCSDLPEDTCVSTGGSPQGAGTSCATTAACSSSQLEACCTASTCMMMPVGQCAEYGWTPHGPGSTCESAGCFAPQACCTSNGCSEMSQDTCISTGGSPQGAGTTCSTSSCYTPPPAGLYWSTATGDINVTLTSGSLMTNEIVTDEPSIKSLHFSHFDSRLYWISNGMFRTCMPNGSDLKTLPVSSAGTPVAVTTDSSSSSLLWTEFYPPSTLNVFSYPLTVQGSEPTLVYSTSATAAGPIAARNYGQHRVYYGYTMGSLGLLGFSPSSDGVNSYPCASPGAVVADILDNPYSTSLYWVETFSASTSGVRVLSGSQLLTLFTRNERIQSITYEPAAGRLYWTVPDRGEIMRSWSDGSSPTLFMAGIQDLQDVAIGPVPPGMGG